MRGPRCARTHEIASLDRFIDQRLALTAELAALAFWTSPMGQEARCLCGCNIPLHPAAHRTLGDLERVRSLRHPWTQRPLPLQQWLDDRLAFTSAQPIAAIDRALLLESLIKLSARDKRYPP